MGSYDYPQKWKGYYLTAYGLAVKHGFKGTEEEWLAFLKANVELRYENGVLEWCNAGVDDWHTLEEFTAFQADLLKKGEDARAAAEAANTAAEASRAQTDAASGAENLRAAAEVLRRAAEEERSGAEALRVSGEAERKSAESDRAREEAARKAAESGRAGAEQARTASETARDQAEQARGAAETERLAAEDRRVVAEGLRKSAEQGRETAEAARAGAETARLEHEAERARSEEARKSAEQMRADGEARRVTAETGRAGAEAQRLEAEAARKSGEQAREAAETERALAEAGRAGAEEVRENAEAARNFWEPYDPQTAYVPGNKVTFNGSSYLNLVACQGVAPTDTAKWRLVAAKGADGEGSGDMLSQVYDPAGKAQDVFAYTDAAAGRADAGIQALKAETVEALGERAQKDLSNVDDSIFKAKAETAGVTTTWNELEGRPDAFPSEPHEHETTDINFGQGKTWIISSLPENAIWSQPVYGDGIWVTFGKINSGRNPVVAWSEDGKNWTAGNIPGAEAETTWNQPVYANGIWVTSCSYSKHSSEDGLNLVTAWSEDGKNWTAGNIPGAESQTMWTKPVYDDDIWVIFGRTVNNLNSAAAWSTDGKIWTYAKAPSTATWHRPAYGNGIWVTCGNNIRSSLAAWSTDGKTWTAGNMPSLTVSWSSPIYGNGIWVSCGNNDGESPVVAWSEDGNSWEYVSLPTEALWTIPVYDNGIWIICGWYSSKAAWSENGKTWTTSTLPTSATWQQPVYANGIWVTLGGSTEVSNTAAAWSIDGKTWTASRMPTSANWQQPVYGNGTWVTLGSKDGKSPVVAWSEDGKTWTASNLPVNIGWQRPVFDNGIWVACSTVSSYAAYSENDPIAKSDLSNVNNEDFKTMVETSGCLETIQADLNAHAGDAVKHVTAEERSRWNHYPVPFTIAVSDWIQASPTEKLPYSGTAILEVANLKATDVVNVNFDRDSYAAAEDAGVSGMTYSAEGMFGIFSESIPTENLSGNYIIIKGAPA